MIFNRLTQNPLLVSRNLTSYSFLKLSTRFFQDIHILFPRDHSVLLPVDCETENKNSASEVLTEETIFNHSDSQDCFEWIPVIVGVSAWGDTDATYLLKDVDDSIEGVASNRNMGLMYTCKFLKFVMHCPCRICRDERRNCRLECRAEVCRDCNIQCAKHIIKLARLFKAENDQFTMITQKMDQYQFAYAYCWYSKKLCSVLTGCSGTSSASSGVP